MAETSEIGFGRSLNMDSININKLTQIRLDTNTFPKTMQTMQLNIIKYNILAQYLLAMAHEPSL